MKSNQSLFLFKKVFFFFLLLFLPFFFARAQEEQLLDSSSSTQSKEAILIANVNLYEAQIEKQENNQVTISFIVSNDEDKYYSDIQYGLEVLRITPVVATDLKTQEKKEINYQELFDFVSYPQDILSLKPHQKIKKQIIYTLPEASGSFQFLVKAFNKEGLLYGFGIAGEIHLNKTIPVELDSTTCYLRLNQEETKYSLKEGVSLKPEEELYLFCTLKNNTNQDQSFSISSKTYQRYYLNGQEINFPNYQETITLSPNQTKEIKIAISRPTIPQAYDTVFTFKNQNYSFPKIAVHYVVSGSSATLQLIKIDRDYYSKGDTAQVTVFWSPAADNFPQSRNQTNQENLKIKLQINSQITNQVCSQEQILNLDSKNLFSQFSLPIIKDCPNPKVLAQIQEKNQF